MEKLEPLIERHGKFLINWNAMPQDPEEVKGFLTSLKQLDRLSTFALRNYSILLDRKPFNYRLDGKELFITNENDAACLVNTLKLRLSPLAGERLGYGKNEPVTDYEI